MKFKKILLIAVLAFGLLLNACNQEEPEYEEIPVEDGNVIGDNSSHNQDEYQVTKVEDQSTEEETRFSQNILIEEELTEEELIELSGKIVKEFKNKQEFDSLTLNLYDSEEYLDGEATLGNVIAKEDTIEYYIMEKDWDLQLNQEEKEVYAYWNKLYRNEDTEKEAYDETCNKFDMKVDELQDILNKYMSWLMSDESN